MATVSIIVKKGERKSDGTWRVYVQVVHKRKPDFIKTDTYVEKSQLNAKLELKDPDVFDNHSDQLKSYRKMIREMADLDEIDVKELRSRLEGKEKKVGVDFIKFIREHIEYKESIGKDGSNVNYRTVMYSLVDYFGSHKVRIEKIDTEFLYEYSEYLKTERCGPRPDQYGRMKDTILKPMEQPGVFKHMSNLRALFGNAKKKYNRGKTKLIQHYPFEDFSLGKKPKPKKRNLTIPQVRRIRDSFAESNSRAELGRDLSMLSFYLCGMNSVDLYQLPAYEGQDRIEYNRSKTRDKRDDDAFISIKVPEEAKPLLYKYAGKLQKRYSSHKYLTKAINSGLKALKLQFYVTHYYLRHSFADIADKNGIRIDEIAHALNHINQEFVVTGIYIGYNWDKVDAVQEKVLFLLKFKDEFSNNVLKVV